MWNLWGSKIAGSHRPRHHVHGWNILLWAAIVLFSGRVDAQEESPRADIEFFENKIRPVLVERCANCHSAQTKQNKGGLQLDSRDEILKGGRSGPSVVSRATRSAAC